jgi:hypothetical protein
MRVMIALLVFSSIMLTVVAAAEGCPVLISAECEGGWAWFGLRHDDANVGQGQSATLPCNTYLLDVEFMFRNSGNPNGGVPALLTGDEIHVTVMDTDGNVYGDAVATMPWDVGEDWITFSFGGIFLEAGFYHFAAWTDVPRQCSFAFCPGQDPYPDGDRIASLDGLAGPWFDFDHEVPFRIYLDNGPVSSETTTWSEVRSTYRP